MFPEIKSYLDQAARSFHSIPEERRENLKKISAFIKQKIEKGSKASLIYVCTHNSRRSHFGQVWGMTAAAYYGVSQIRTYSAGTEATAFHPHAVKALRETGFKITMERVAINPRYEVLYDEENAPIICFSKTWKDYSIPRNGLCAIMTCTEADGNCPSIPGTELRIACSYTDPKTFDGTPLQNEKYAERCLQIATENLYIFSLLQ